MMNMKCFVLLACICGYVLSFPCLTDDSKKGFSDSRKALTTLKTYLNETVSTLETDMQNTLTTLKNHITNHLKNVDGKIKTLDNDLQLLENDFKGKLLYDRMIKNVEQWLSYVYKYVMVLVEPYQILLWILFCSSPTCI